MAEHAPQRACALRARCTHTQQGSITALPLLAFAERPLLGQPNAAVLAAPTDDASPRGLARRIEAPPPRFLA